MFLDKKKTVLVSLFFVLIMFFVSFSASILKPNASAIASEIDVIGDTSILLEENVPVKLNIHTSSNSIPIVTLKVNGSYLTVDRLLKDPELSFTVNSDGQKYGIYIGATDNVQYSTESQTLNYENVDTSSGRIGLRLPRDTDGTITIVVSRKTPPFKQAMNGAINICTSLFEIAGQTVSLALQHPIILFGVLLTIFGTALMIFKTMIKGV